jgi:hypothetical protein
VASRCPGAAAMRALTQPAFIDEDDGSPLFLGSGQRSFFERRIATSSRSSARPAGRGRLQPICCRIFQTCPGWYRMPHSRSIKSATRGAVHKLVSYPSTSGPRFSSCAIRRNSAAFIRGLRPARPAFFSAVRPSPSTCLAQRCTVCRCTPSMRAISAWLSPCWNKRAARKRRASNASKSRFTPRGLPIPTDYAKSSIMSSILCEILCEIQ